MPDAFVADLVSMDMAAVMAGLVPAIHVFDRAPNKDVDARRKAGHDESMQS
jgi:hypothetical protein